MAITVTGNPFVALGRPVEARKALALAPQATPEPHEEFADVCGARTMTYERGLDGSILATGGKAEPSSSRNLLEIARNVFLPRNVETSVSADYLPTRACTFVRDAAFNMGNFATGAAMAVALGMSPVWGGAAMATFNLIRDRVCQTAGFAFTFATPMADRNPRPWMVAGELIDNAGGVMESMAAVVPGLVLPVSLVSAVVRVFGGCMRGASQANIDPRQAVGDNLGELRAKNGNQGFVSSLLGSMAGMALLHSLTPSLGCAAAPAVAAAAAVVSVAAMGAMVKRLDLHPVNEQAVRGLVQRGSVAPPERNGVWKTVMGVRQRDHLMIGSELRGLLQDPARFDELRHMYQGRNYILEVRSGSPYVVLRDGCEPADRFQAVLQAAHVEHLQETEEYRTVLAKDGAPAADRWLAEKSLAATPASVGSLLGEMKKQGWSTDMLRFLDSGKRARWEAGASSQGLVTAA